MFYFVFCLVPCYALLPPCLPSPSYFRPPQFPFYYSCSPPSPHSLVRVFCHSSCCSPPPLFSWTPPTADARRCLLSSASASCHLIMNRSTASRIRVYWLSAFSFDSILMVVVTLLYVDGMIGINAIIRHWFTANKWNNNYIGALGVQHALSCLFDK